MYSSDSDKEEHCDLTEYVELEGTLRECSFADLSVNVKRELMLLMDKEGCMEGYIGVATKFGYTNSRIENLRNRASNARDVIYSPTMLLFRELEDKSLDGLVKAFISLEMKSCLRILKEMQSNILDEHSKNEATGVGGVQLSELVMYQRLQTTQGDINLRLVADLPPTLRQPQPALGSRDSIRAFVSFSYNGKDNIRKLHPLGVFLQDHHVRVTFDSLGLNGNDADKLRKQYSKANFVITVLSREYLHEINGGVGRYNSRSRDIFQLLQAEYRRNQPLNLGIRAVPVIISDFPPINAAELPDCLTFVSIYRWPEDQYRLVTYLTSSLL